MQDVVTGLNAMPISVWIYAAEKKRLTERGVVDDDSMCRRLMS